jgi:hypothetical protein
MAMPTGWSATSNYAKDHSPKRGNKIGVAAASAGAGDGYAHEADINQAEGNSGMNSSLGVKDAKHHNPAPRAAALDNWKRGVTGGHAADGAHDRKPTKQATGHAPYHKPNTSARGNGLAMWQEGVDSKHDQHGEHAVPEQFNNKK